MPEQVVLPGAADRRGEPPRAPEPRVTAARPHRATLPVVTVVVPVRDGSDGLDRCLAALDRQDYPAELLQVVVADNASTEDIAAVVSRHPPAVCVAEPRGGSYRARNAAIAVARGDVLAFTDGDCDPQHDWVSELVAALRHEPAADMVGGRMALTYHPAGGPVTGSELYEAVHAFPQEYYLERRGFAVTANMAAWRSTFDRVGLFNAALLSSGDVEWGTRVRAAGGLQRYAPAAVVRHPARASLHESVRKFARVARGAARHEYGGWSPLALVRRPVLWALRDAVLEVGRVHRFPQLSTTRQRGRYLLVHTVQRVVWASVFTRTALERATRGRVTAGRTAPPAAGAAAP